MSNPLDIVLTEGDWAQFGECNRDGAIGPMFPDPGDAKGEAVAKGFCAQCPVLAECLDYAMRNGERYGIWGGTTPEERTAMRRAAMRRQHRATKISSGDTTALDKALAA